MDASGNALVVWHQSDGTWANAWTSRYDAWTGWGSATRLETDDAGDATNPQIAIDGSGNAIAVWQQYDGTRDDIRAKRFW